MKGGLLTGFHAVDVLQEARFGGFGRITYVCNPDEEIGSPMSGPVIRELAPAHDAAFVLEGARANGDIVSARKGITDYAIEFVGRGACRRRAREGGERGARGRESDDRDAGAERSLARGDRERRRRSGAPARTWWLNAASSRSTCVRPSSRPSSRPRPRSMHLRNPRCDRRDRAGRG